MPVWSLSPGGTEYYINSAAVCADGSRVITGTFLHTYSEAREPATQAVAGGVRVEGGSDTGTFGTYCYDASGVLQWKDEFNGWQGVYWVGISADGTCAASGGWFSGSPSYAGFVRAYDVATGTMLLNHATPGRVNQVTLSSDGTWLLAATTTLLLFKRVGGAYQLTGQFDPGGTDNTVITADMSADGLSMNQAAGLVAVADGHPDGSPGNFYLLEGAGGALCWSYATGNMSWPIQIAANGAAIVAGSDDSRVYYFDMAGTAAPVQ